MTTIAGSILLADDEEKILKRLGRALRDDGHDVVEATTIGEAQRHLGERPFDLLVVDNVMPGGMTGLDLIRELASTTPATERPQIVMMTAHGSTQIVREAFKLGVEDFLEKPFEIDELLVLARRAVRSHRLQNEKHYLISERDAEFNYYGIVGRARSMQDVIHRADLVAQTKSTVLITGETGTGKEVVARVLHQHGKRRNGPFVAVNCSALPEALLESSLFGHVRGAFTDARAPKQGLFLEAHGGTLTVTSPAGGGAAFTIALPVGTVHEAVAETEVAPEQAAVAHKVLIVDDEAEIRDALTEILASAQHRVVAVASGREALERLAGEHFDAILTDIRMPDIDGRALYQEIARRWSRRQRIFILEDAAYRELRYDGPVCESVWSCDAPRRHVIYTQTYSKSFSPGVRVGFGVVPRDLVQPICDRKGNEDFGSSNFNQHLIATVLRSGLYEQHVADVCAAYRAKRNAMLSAAAELFAGLPGVEWVSPQGGLYVWLSLPESIETGFRSRLFDAAVRTEGVMYVPGELCYAGAPGDVPRHQMRLSYGVQPPEGIREGMRRLAAAVQSVLAEQA